MSSTSSVCARTSAARVIWAAMLRPRRRGWSAPTAGRRKSLGGQKAAPFQDAVRWAGKDTSGDTRNPRDNLTAGRRRDDCYYILVVGGHHRLRAGRRPLPALAQPRRAPPPPAVAASRPPPSIRRFRQPASSWTPRHRATFKLVLRPRGWLSSTGCPTRSNRMAARRGMAWSTERQRGTVAGVARLWPRAAFSLAAAHTPSRRTSALRGAANTRLDAACRNPPQPWGPLGAAPSDSGRRGRRPGSFGPRLLFRSGRTSAQRP